ncbi:G5 domain-containing protein, partial [Dolosigranulum pigrum]
MVGKNNHKVRTEQGANKFKRYTLKKLSIGVASVSIGVGLMFNGAEVVSAEEAGQDVAGGSVEEVVEDSEAPFSSEVETLNEEIEETVVEDDRSVEEVNDSEPTDVLQNGGDDAEVDGGKSSEINDVAKDEAEQEATVSEDRSTVSPIDNEEDGQSNRVSSADIQNTHPEITPQTPTTQYTLDDVRHFFNAEEIKRIEAGQLTVKQALQNALSIQSDVQENKDYHEENVLAAGTRRSTNIEARSTAGRRMTRAVDAPYYMPQFTMNNTAKDVLNAVDQFVKQNNLTTGEHYLFRYEVARRVSDRRFNKGRGNIVPANAIADTSSDGGNAFNRPLSVSDRVSVNGGANRQELAFINDLATKMNDYLSKRNTTGRKDLYPATRGSYAATNMGELSNIRINEADRTVTANITIGRNRNNDENAYIGHQVRVAGELANITRQVSDNATNVARPTDGETHETLAWTGSNSASTNHQFTIKSGGLLHQTEIQDPANSDIITGVISQPWSLNTPNGTFIENKQHQEGAKHYAELLNVVAKYNTIEDKLQELKTRIRAHNERVQAAKNDMSQYTLGQYEELKKTRKSITHDRPTVLDQYNQLANVTRYNELPTSLIRSLEQEANLPKVEQEPPFNLALLDSAISENQRIDQIDVDLTNKTEESVTQYNEAKQKADAAMERAEGVRANPESLQGVVNDVAQELTLANQALERAINNLESKTDMEALRQAVNESDDIITKPLFTLSEEVTKNAYTEAINAGREILASDSATQDQVNAAVDRINKAKNNLDGLNTRIEEKETTIPHTVEHRIDFDLAYGKMEVDQVGEDGTEKEIYEYDIDPDTGEPIETSKRLVSRVVVKKPQTRIERYGMKLESKATDTYVEIIPYDVQTTNDDTLYVGMQVVDTEGVVGERTTKTPLVFRNGELVRDEDNQTTEITREKVDKVVRVGMKPLPNLENMKNNIDTLKSDLAEANKQIEVLDGRVGSNETVIQEAQSNITDIQNKLAEQEKQLGELQTETERLDEAIKATDSKVGELAKTVETKEQALQESINGLRNELETEKGKLNDAIGRIEKNEQDIDSIKQNIENIENDANVLAGRVGELETRASALSDNLQKEIEDRKKAIEGLNTQLDEAKKQLEDDANANKEALENTLNGLRNDLNTEKDKLVALTTRVETNETAIEALQTKADALEQTADKLGNDLTALSERTDKLDESLQKEITDRQQAIENVKSQLEETKQELENNANANKQALEDRLTNLS